MNNEIDYRDMYLLAGSEELSQEFNELASIYSDLYKDVYGFRPRAMALCACDYPSHDALFESMSHLRRMMDGLNAYAPTVFDAEERQREACVKSFEKTIAANISYGARNRSDAIAWICDSYDVQNNNSTYGWEHLEYLLDIPFGYIQKSLKEAA
jgi:hypothetical protein